MRVCTDTDADTEYRPARHGSVHVAQRRVVGSSEAGPHVTFPSLAICDVDISLLQLKSVAGQLLLHSTSQPLKLKPDFASFPAPCSSHPQHHQPHPFPFIKPTSVTKADAALRLLHHYKLRLGSTSCHLLVLLHPTTTSELDRPTVALELNTFQRVPARRHHPRATGANS